ncbi:Sec-independent protein translocase protein TatA [Amylibacter marinus]|uniref:Sec-independent protein translocase protein TatA n=1 Tax=Amylibacter marinus TaxID=1475483 RepID=A0ABQ5VTI4_9RHOB|nr:twin-arginine translocase TatA/TatE family subunit [Amylibacter marinus]GLQ34748.1 Sec-independent protein translocase protein TatA [Amylibacter marinus]
MIVTPLFIQNVGPMGMLVIAVVVLVLFGRGKITNLMGEVGKGITAFKKGVNEGKEELTASIDDAADAAKDVTPDSDKTNS